MYELLKHIKKKVKNIFIHFENKGREGIQDRLKKLESKVKNDKP